MECIRLRPAEEVPRDARVYDYDELPERLRHRLSRSVESDATGTICLPAPENGPGSDDYVRFIEYYRVFRS
jgi:hypothetical protein